MKLSRGPSRFWAFLHRIGLARAHMPFWRVVVEAHPGARLARVQRQAESAVAAVFVWARTIEEAEGLASLAVEQEGFTTVTADAVKIAPAAAPRRAPNAVARGEFGFLPRDREGAADPHSRRDART